MPPEDPTPEPQSQRSAEVVHYIRMELDADQAAKEACSAINDLLHIAKLGIQELQRRAEKARELDAR